MPCLPGVRDASGNSLPRLRHGQPARRKVLQEMRPASGHDASGRGGGEVLLAPELYPKHLAEKILTSKSALEGERKQVTVIFADLKGSMSC
jgi:hypothetical protein